MSGPPPLPLPPPPIPVCKAGGRGAVLTEDWTARALWDLWTERRDSPQAGQVDPGPQQPTRVESSNSTLCRSTLNSLHRVKVKVKVLINSGNKVMLTAERWGGLSGRWPLCSRTVVVQSLSGVRLFMTPWTAVTRPPCPSPSPRAYSNSCPLSR